MFETLIHFGPETIKMNGCSHLNVFHANI